MKNYLPLLSLLAVLIPHAAGAANCDRACLKKTLDTYLDAVLKHDPSKAPLDAAFRYTENSTVVATGEGLWKTATALGIPGPDGLWAALGIGAASVAAAWSALRRDPETAIVVALTGTILFFPFFHPHYLVQLLIPAAFLAGRGQWWGLALPLLGWLPGPALAPVAIVATLAPLLPPGFLAISVGAGLRGGAAEFGTDPTRP